MSAGRLIRSVMPCTACCRTSSVVRDHDQGIYVFLEFFDSHQRIAHTGSCLEFERFCYNADSQNAHFFCNACYNRCCTCSGSAAHTAGDEYHISAFHDLFELFDALLGCFLSNLRFCSCAQSLSQLLADLENGRCLTEGQRLFIGVDSNEFNAADGFLHHSIYSIISCTTYTDYDNLCR